MLAGRGTTLVEILIALGILAAAIVPIAGTIQGSYGQLAAEKAEAAASTFASAKLNEAVFNKPYDDVVDASGDEEVDHTKLHWTLSVQEVAGLTLQFQKFPYHTPCGGGCTAAGGSTQNVAWNTVDRKDAGKAGGVLKTLRLELAWTMPGRLWGTPLSRRVVFVTRKARLE